MADQYDKRPTSHKLDVYLGYGDVGLARKTKIMNYCKRHKVSLPTLILELLRKQYPEMGL